MSPDAMKEQNAILSGWVDEHLRAEIRHAEAYLHGGAAKHKAESEAHARAALALQREVEGGGKS